MWTCLACKKAYPYNWPRYPYALCKQCYYTPHIVQAYRESAEASVNYEGPSGPPGPVGPVGTGPCPIGHQGPQGEPGIPEALPYDLYTSGQFDDAPMAEELPPYDPSILFVEKDLNQYSDLPFNVEDGTIRPGRDMMAYWLSEMGADALAGVLLKAAHKNPTGLRYAMRTVLKWDANPHLDSFREELAAPASNVLAGNAPESGRGELPVSGLMDRSTFETILLSQSLYGMPVSVWKTRRPDDKKTYPSNPADAELNYMFNNGGTKFGKALKNLADDTLRGMNPCGEIPIGKPEDMRIDAPDGRTAEQHRELMELKEHYERYRGEGKPDRNSDIYLESGLAIQVKEPEEAPAEFTTNHGPNMARDVYTKTGETYIIGDVDNAFRRSMEQSAGVLKNQITKIQRERLDKAGGYGIAVPAAKPDATAITEAIEKARGMFAKLVGVPITVFDPPNTPPLMVDIHDPSVPEDAFDYIAGGVAVGHLPYEEQKKAVDIFSRGPDLPAEVDPEQFFFKMMQELAPSVHFQTGPSYDFSELQRRVSAKLHCIGNQEYGSQAKCDAINRKQFAEAWFDTVNEFRREGKITHDYTNYTYHLIVPPLIQGTTYKVSHEDLWGLSPIKAMMTEEDTKFLEAIDVKVVEAEDVITDDEPADEEPADEEPADECDFYIPSPPFASRPGVSGLVTVDMSSFYKWAGGKEYIENLSPGEWDALSQKLPVISVPTYRPKHPGGGIRVAGDLVKRSKKEMHEEIACLNAAAGYSVE